MRSDSDDREGEIGDQEAAEYLLRSTQLEATDAVRLVMELLEESPSRNMEDNTAILSHCRRVIHMGIQAHEQSGMSVTFSEAAVALQAHKTSVRERTLAEIRQICQRIIRHAPEWEHMSMRQIDTTACQRIIERIFLTIPSQRKAKRILHAIFAYGVVNGWCTRNPLDLVALAPHKERPICALPIERILALLETAKQPEHILCAPGLGLMLWAGIRPHELTRLHRSNIHFEDRVITIPATHSKTGGARQVTIYPPLYYWLRSYMYFNLPHAPIVPAGWAARWARLRKEAGFSTWVPDILRHTFASYHLKYFRDLYALQVDMGHTSPELLRTRYLGMQNVTTRAAKIFWEYGVP